MVGRGEFQGSARRQVRGVCAVPDPEYRVAACVIAGDPRFSLFPGLRSSGARMENDAIYDPPDADHTWTVKVYLYR